MATDGKQLHITIKNFEKIKEYYENGIVAKHAYREAILLETDEEYVVSIHTDTNINPKRLTIIRIGRNSDRDGMINIGIGDSYLALKSYAEKLPADAVTIEAINELLNRNGIYL